MKGFSQGRGLWKAGFDGAGGVAAARIVKRFVAGWPEFGRKRRGSAVQAAGRLSGVLYVSPPLLSCDSIGP